MRYSKESYTQKMKINIAIKGWDFFISQEKRKQAVVE
jgi:hypothetical protein